MSGNPASVPPLPPPADFVADVQRLEPQANHHVKDQHVVSKVVLGQFTERWGTKQELQLAGLDLEHVQHRPTYGGPRRFGKVPNFVLFASASIETVWKETEDRLRDALDAIEDGTVFDGSTHVDTIRDTFVLHFVRSIPALFIHDNAWIQNRETFRQFALQFPHHLEEIFRQEHRLYPAGPEGFDMAYELLIAKSTEDKERGAFFRVGLEDKFNRYRHHARSYGVEIFRSELDEFVIGDIPALSIRYGQTSTGVRGGVGLATADELVMPLGPKSLAVLGNHDRSGFVKVSGERVREYNVMQIQDAYRHVHFRPGSGLEALIRSVERPVRYPPLPGLNEPANRLT